MPESSNNPIQTSEHKHATDDTLIIEEERSRPEDDIEPLPGNPGLSIAAVIFGVVGIILAVFVSWALSVVAGVVAVVLGHMAKRRNSPHQKAALAGQVMGFICIVANTALVLLYIYQLMSLGIL